MPLNVYTYEAAKRACVRDVYGGCGGNENRFTTRAECEHTCEVPETGPTSCPASTTRAEACLGCAPEGGCVESAFVCAQTCVEDDDCAGTKWYARCVDGLCHSFYGCD